MMGKQKCDMLKALRRKIISQYPFIQIPPQEECSFKGNCPGFCPACDAELLEITRQLETTGADIELGLGTDIFNEYLAQYDASAFEANEAMRDYISNHRLMGRLMIDPKKQGIYGLDELSPLRKRAYLENSSKNESESSIDNTSIEEEIEHFLRCYDRQKDIAKDSTVDEELGALRNSLNEQNKNPEDSKDDDAKDCSH